ncbi:hypothetical protein SISNIDRAFT_530277 [Sistotremastrum niveocremeum HHB9708]|uniref:Uncharacterized protein n=1 Tax=Sistotremastrum niveocremeum HHB9708 TaxID=1314777 RepID=A0A164Z1R9_9AGAM|nr:hypothetical protein SISNIDRAFT_530277 [Sistotremastrum niveocremeum HHB9708]
MRKHLHIWFPSFKDVAESSYREGWPTPHIYVLLIAAVDIASTWVSNCWGIPVNPERVRERYARAIPRLSELCQQLVTHFSWVSLDCDPHHYIAHLRSPASSGELVLPLDGGIFCGTNEYTGFYDRMLGQRLFINDALYQYPPLINIIYTLMLCHPGGFLIGNHISATPAEVHTVDWRILPPYRWYIENRKHARVFMSQDELEMMKMAYDEGDDIERQTYSCFNDPHDPYDTDEVYSPMSYASGWSYRSRSRSRGPMSTSSRSGSVVSLGGMTSVDGADDMEEDEE